MAPLLTSSSQLWHPSYPTSRALPGLSLFYLFPASLRVVDLQVDILHFKCGAPATDKLPVCPQYLDRVHTTSGITRPQLSASPSNTSRPLPYLLCPTWEMPQRSGHGDHRDHGDHDSVVTSSVPGAFRGPPLVIPMSPSPSVVVWVLRFPLQHRGNDSRGKRRDLVRPHSLPKGGS